MALASLVKKLFGSRNQRTIKKYNKLVVHINELESQWLALSDAALRAKTTQFKQRLQEGETVDDLLPEAFATVRETARRTLSMRHFDVQLIGAMCLHEGRIAEMHTGEGKTLMATLAAYLNALSGAGVHVITVNDYLAKRDADWMRPIYDFLGLTVGVILSEMDKHDKQSAYRADITYGTNNEYGFDYLRDNMAFNREERVQRGLHFAIIDEVDSILIDEARTPLIISGPAEDSSDMYQKINALIPQLSRQVDETGPGDYSVDEKSKQAFLTEAGHIHVETRLIAMGVLTDGESLYSSTNISLMHHVTAALRAHALFQRDVDYIVRHHEVIIVDEHTGRTMPGRRWSDGLHQAVEAKEGVTIQPENQTLASITFQNYFRLYQKLSGMTGTADTEAYEFHEIYHLDVVVVPTNQPNQRIDSEDLVFLTAKEKFDAIVSDIKQRVDKHQPVLVGTASIETSELLSTVLSQHHIKHQVLNAKFHQQEAQIIAEAGRPGSVTIATNMAGRGTDIVLGGSLASELDALESPSDADIEERRCAWKVRHEQVIEAGGLHVIGSERHESRRIDNQLRGRSARQGDPGSTCFYLSLDDNLMRIFASPGMVSLMRRLHTEEGEPLQSKMLSKGIESAQRKVEGRNFDIRKQLLEFDDVANEQRKAIYAQRDELMAIEDISENIEIIIQAVIEQLVAQYVPANTLEEQWQVDALEQALHTDFGLTIPAQAWLDADDTLHAETLQERVVSTVQQAYHEKAARLGAVLMNQFQKAMMLQLLDQHWKDHLAAMDYLRQSVNLRGYAQKDPKQEYKREAFTLFTDMLDKLKQNIASAILQVEVEAELDVAAVEEMHRQQQTAGDVLEFKHPHIDGVLAPSPAAQPEDNSPASARDSAPVVPITTMSPKPGRNAPCPCGSGKKYKHCHGRVQ